MANKRNFDKDVIHLINHQEKTLLLAAISPDDSITSYNLQLHQNLYLYKNPQVVLQQLAK